MTPATHQESVTRESLAQTRGSVVVEFGASWCGICRGFAPQMQKLLGGFPAVQHIKVEDGKGKPLGRSFGVTLWPTFVFLRDGVVEQVLVRPDSEAVKKALERIT